jgi:hypothetical protein
MEVAIKLDEFISLKKEDHSILQYVGKLNYSSRYALGNVRIDSKKKNGS